MNHYDIAFIVFTTIGASVLDAASGKNWLARTVIFMSLLFWGALYLVITRVALQW